MTILENAHCEQFGGFFAQPSRLSVKVLCEISIVIIKYYFSAMCHSLLVIFNKVLFLSHFFFCLHMTIFLPLPYLKVLFLKATI